MGVSLGQTSQLLSSVDSMKLRNFKDALKISKFGPPRLAYVWQKSTFRLEDFGVKLLSTHQRKETIIISFTIITA
jgi:hypothetical protein